MAKLFFRYGTMGSSKSADLLITAYNYERKGLNTLLLKPVIDTRDCGVIKSRMGLKKECISFNKTQDLYGLFNKVKTWNNISCILVDEAQFLTKKQVLELLQITLDFNIPVICYGLRSDYMCNGFEGSKALLTLAHDIKELKTICKCGKKATTHLLKVDNKYVFEGKQIHIGDKEFEEVCYECYFKTKRERGF